LANFNFTGSVDFITPITLTLEFSFLSLYNPTICRSLGMKLQAVSEVTKSTDFKALEDELAVEAIVATQRNWA
jgi:hypothetical protein